MKKRFSRAFALLLSAICLLSLTACHSANQIKAFEAPESFDESREYEITFWAKNDTNMTQVEIYHKAIEDFEACYPNIHVTLRLYTDYGKIYNDVITNIPTGTTPNVCISYPDHIATYLTGVNTVVPLDTLFDHPEYGLGGSALRFDGVRQEEIVSRHLEEGRLGEHIYALPFMRSTEACYVNKTFVEKLGYTLPETLTWDFMWEVAEAATKKDADGVYAVNGQKVMIPIIYKSTDNMMIQYLRQSNAPYSTEDGQIDLFHDTTKELLYAVASHAESGAFSTFKISSYPANFLNAGQCIFAIDSTAGATWMGSDAPLCDISEDKIVDFETAVLLPPQLDPENPVMISQGPSVCVFNKDDPQEVLASWLFTQFLLTNGVQIAYSKTEGYVPVTEVARESGEYQDYLARCGEDGDEHYDIKIKATRLLLDNTENTFVTPVFNGSASLRDASGELIENVTKSVRRNATVDEAYMETLFEDVTALYRLDSISRSGTLSMTDGEDLGPLPTASVVLLAALGGIWVLIAVWFFCERAKKKKRNRQQERV